MRKLIAMSVIICIFYTLTRVSLADEKYYISKKIPPDNLIEKALKKLNNCYDPHAIRFIKIVGKVKMAFGIERQAIYYEYQELSSKKASWSDNVILVKLDTNIWILHCNRGGFQSIEK